jgi:hypothetical protein
MSAGLGLIIVIAGILIYFLPAIIAGSREHHQATAIFILNFLLGWTFAGWVIALVWACTETRKQSVAVTHAIAASAIEDRRPQRDCPHCAERILVEAKICKHCSREVVRV